MTVAKNPRADAEILGDAKADPRGARKSKVEIAISGPGIVTIRSANLVKSAEARRQISALKRLKEGWAN